MRARIPLLLVLVMPAAAAAQDLSAALRSFDQGNRNYRRGDFETAIENYRHALDLGYESGAMYLNIGNAYFRLDNIGQSIRYYEKARRLIPDSPELQHNLDIAAERTTDRFSQLPEPFWRPFWSAIEEPLGPIGLFAVGIFFYLAACVALAAQIRTGRTPWRRRIQIAGAGVGLCFVALAFVSSREKAERDEAVVMSDEVALLDAPEGTNADMLVHEGLVVDVVSSSGPWREIRLPNGARGWLDVEDLGEI